MSNETKAIEATYYYTKDEDDEPELNIKGSIAEESVAHHKPGLIAEGCIVESGLWIPGLAVAEAREFLNGIMRDDGSAKFLYLKEKARALLATLPEVGDE